MRHKTELFIWSPFLLAVIAAYYKSVWLVVVTVITMFIMVAVLSFTHKRENLWLFILCGICSIPINIFLVNEFLPWKKYIFHSYHGLSNILLMVGLTLICTSIEEILVAFVGRIIWKKQYDLMLPKI